MTHPHIAFESPREPPQPGPQQEYPGHCPIPPMPTTVPALLHEKSRSLWWHGTATDGMGVENFGFSMVSCQFSCILDWLQETMLLNHHNFSLPIRKSRGFAVGKTHLVRLKPSSLAHECGYWGESKAGVVHVHILAVSFRGITQKVRLSIYIICIASLMPMHTHSDIYIYVLYYIYIYIYTYTNTQWLSWRCRPPPSSVFLGNL